MLKAFDLRPLPLGVGIANPPRDGKPPNPPKPPAELEDDKLELLDELEDELLDELEDELKLLRLDIELDELNEDILLKLLRLDKELLLDLELKEEGKLNEEDILELDEEILAGMNACRDIELTELVELSSLGRNTCLATWLLILEKSAPNELLINPKPPEDKEGC